MPITNTHDTSKTQDTSNLLGVGAMGKVFKKSEQGKNFAVKTFNTESISEADKQLAINSFLNEIAIHKELNHPNIVQYLSSSSEDNNPTQWTIEMELADQGDCFDYLFKNFMNENKWNENKCKKIMQDISEGLQYLHRLSVIHLDLKLENVLLFRSPTGQLVAKLCDFGFAKKLENNNTSIIATTCGTLRYVAPEVLYKNTFSYASDIYSLALLFYTLVACKTPHDYIADGNLVILTDFILRMQFLLDETNEQTQEHWEVIRDYYSRISEKLMEYLIKNNYQAPLPKDCSEECINLIDQCRDPVPGKRLTIDKITERLKNISLFRPISSPTSTSELEELSQCQV